MDVALDGPQVADPDPRGRVFAAVLAQGPISAAMLAARFDVTPAAVRRHLDALESDGLIESVGAQASGQRGRPARMYVVTAKGQESARGHYDELASSALAFLAEHAGADAVARFAERYMAERERSWAGQLRARGRGPAAGEAEASGRAGETEASAEAEAGTSGTADRTSRVAALAEALSRDGYAASARPVAARRRRSRRGGGLAERPRGVPVDGTQLCQGHCPVAAVASRYPELCEAETRAFSRLLGVHVQRLSTIAAGAHVCTTFVPHPRDGESRPPGAPAVGRSRRPGRDQPATSHQPASSDEAATSDKPAGVAEPART